jgi:hypothetical protein
MNVLAVNLVVVFFIFAVLCMHSLRPLYPYPRQIIDSFHEPVVRFASYVLVYGLCYYNATIGMLSGLCVLLLHLDYINLYL